MLYMYKQEEVKYVVAADYYTCGDTARVSGKQYHKWGSMVLYTVVHNLLNPVTA